MAFTYPKTELATRDWLRTKTEITSLLANDSRRIDVDVTMVKNNQGATVDPQPAVLTVYRAGGVPEGYSPLDRAVLSFDCWGGSRRAALDLQTALMGVLHSLASESLNSETIGYGAAIESVIWLPDPGGRARYVVTAEVTARLAVPAA